MNHRKPAPPPARLRVAAAQLNPRGPIEQNLESIAACVREAKRRRADVLLLPECATTGYTCDFSRLSPVAVLDALRTLSDLAFDHKIHVLAGSVVYVGRRRFNCLVAFNRAGTPVHAYAKCQLTSRDTRFFKPGNAVALFEIDGKLATAIICHERRYPELVRLPVMMGARLLFHPNAGLDALSVSRKKRDGRDGIPARAFENDIYYVFANTVGPQGKGKWSAGDTKIVGPDQRVLAWVGNREEGLAVASLDLSKATGRYAQEGAGCPEFLAPIWRLAMREARHRATESCRELLAPILNSLKDRPRLGPP